MALPSNADAIVGAIRSLGRACLLVNEQLQQFSSSLSGLQHTGVWFDEIERFDQNGPFPDWIRAVEAEAAALPAKLTGRYDERFFEVAAAAAQEPPPRPRLREGLTYIPVSSIPSQEKVVVMPRRAGKSWWPEAAGKHVQCRILDGFSPSFTFVPLSSIHAVQDALKDWPGRERAAGWGQW